MVSAAADLGFQKLPNLGSRPKLTQVCEDHSRFITQWDAAHAAEAEFVGNTTNRGELPLQSPELSLQSPELSLQSPELSLQSPELSLQSPELSLQSPELPLQYPELPSPHTQETQGTEGAPFSIQSVPVKALPATLPKFVDYLLDAVPLPSWEVQAPPGKGRVRWTCVRASCYRLEVLLY
jgi:hypothetical protein